MKRGINRPPFIFYDPERSGEGQWEERPHKPELAEGQSYRRPVLLELELVLDQARQTLEGTQAQEADLRDQLSIEIRFETPSKCSCWMERISCTTATSLCTSMAPSGKNKFTERDNRCFRCLRQGHLRANCVGRIIECRFCRSTEHHYLLCLLENEGADCDQWEVKVVTLQEEVKADLLEEFSSGALGDTVTRKKATPSKWCWTFWTERGGSLRWMPCPIQVPHTTSWSWKRWKDWASPEPNVNTPSRARRTHHHPRGGMRHCDHVQPVRFNLPV